MARSRSNPIVGGARTARVSAASCLLALGLAGCGAGQPLTLEGVYAASFTGVESSERLVLHSDTEWTELWTDVVRGQSEPPAKPAVDFGRKMLLFAALGTRLSGGFQVGITEAVLDGDLLRVEVRESQWPGCPTIAALTQPVVAVAVERGNWTVSFHDVVRSVPCGQ